MRKRRRRKAVRGVGARTKLGERCTRHGLVMITPLQRKLLAVLHAEPERMFPTQRAWALATARVYDDVYGNGLGKAIGRLPAAWVTRAHAGAAYVCTLQARGLDIVEGRVRVWVIGVGEQGRVADSRAEKTSRSGASPCLGQVLDWLDYLGLQETDGNEDRDQRLRDQVASAEIDLSVLIAEGLGAGSEMHALAAYTCARNRDLQSFRRCLAGLPDDALGSAGRWALTFPKPSDQAAALEEVVLVAESRRQGLTPARERRVASYAEQLEALGRRLVASLPGRTPPQEG